MFVYAMRGGGYVKIGVSDNIEKRLSSFNGGALPFEMSLVCLGETDTEAALEIEADILHAMPRLRGEWIDGSVTDAAIITTFQAWKWGVMLIAPTSEQVARASRDTEKQRQLDASRAIALAMETNMPKAVDWHRIATELTQRGDVGALRKVKKAFRAKMLAAQHRASK